MERLFVDTGAWLALVNRADPAHGAVVAVLTTFNGRLVTSNYVVDETITVCRFRLGFQAAQQLGQRLMAAVDIDVIRLTAEDEQAAWHLFQAREDKPYSFTDCTSFVLMRRLKLGRAAAVDDDFRREGFEVTPVR
jgi:predicted nucleic acid-binding protein